MKEFIKEINEYAGLLKEGAVWKRTKDILAPVITELNTETAQDNYIYEFYCFISLIVDLTHNYEIEFIPGSGRFKYKFPQAASEKKGKPKFIALKHKAKQFQICAGTKISCELDSEDNNPDISFQLPEASDTPTQEDLIIIIDAKFKEHGTALPKSEIYNFGMIVNLFKLTGPQKVAIKFYKFEGLSANCLITNGKAYSDTDDVRLLKKLAIKEVENFYPRTEFKILG